MRLCPAATAGGGLREAATAFASGMRILLGAGSSGETEADLQDKVLSSAWFVTCGISAVTLSGSTLIKGGCSGWNVKVLLWDSHTFWAKW